MNMKYKCPWAYMFSGLSFAYACANNEFVGSLIFCSIWKAHYARLRHIEMQVHLQDRQAVSDPTTNEDSCSGSLTGVG